MFKGFFILIRFYSLQSVFDSYILLSFEVTVMVEPRLILLFWFSGAIVICGVFGNACLYSGFDVMFASFFVISSKIPWFTLLFGSKVSRS